MVATRDSRLATEMQLSLEKLIDESNDAITVTDLAGRITFWSRAAQEMLGYSEQDALGRPVTDFYARGSEEAHKVMDILRSSIRIKNWETELRAKDGRTIPANISITLLHNDRGVPIGTLGIVRDVSEVRALQRKLLENQRLAAIGELATHIAHEIRNPLSSVKMNLKILSRLAKLDRDADLHMRIALEEVDHLEQILHEIFEFLGPHTPRRDPIDMKKLLEEAVELCRHDLESKRVPVQIEVDSRIPRVYGDNVRLRQSLVNLLLNSAQASTEGPVELSASLQDHDVVLEVRDRGTGIDPEILAQVFEPFFTTRSDGTGLGLAITRKIVENHGGTISIRPRPGGGTTVTLRLPLTG